MLYSRIGCIPDQNCPEFVYFLERPWARHVELGETNLQLGRSNENRLHTKRFLGHVDRRSISTSPELPMSAPTNLAGFRGGVGADNEGDVLHPGGAQKESD
jgi:hypothetical protein